MNNPYVLPKEVTPVKYDIEIQPDFKNLTFSGKVNIEINILKDTKEIKINSNEINITKVKLIQNKEFLVKKIDYNKKYQVVSFTFNEIIKKGTARLYIEFSGNVSESLRGLYKGVYHNEDKEKIMLTTQFEPTDARKCFPCFDEPSLKSRFNLTLLIPSNLDAVSNMPIKHESMINNLRKITFQETPIMSTYLLAFVIAELEYLEGKTKNNVLVRIITTPGNKYKSKFALETAIKTLEYYEDYFKIPYPLPKLDLIAIPDFEAAAMENWGLITYREVDLLYDEKESSIGTKQSITYVIGHEIAHQWFGDLVTMRWWNDLWLNEGFATFMGYKVTNHLFPEFDIWTQYLTDEKIPALYLDCLNNSHPIEVEITDPGRINEIFDAISYNKGSCVIRMIEEFLGEEVFRDGLRHYLNKFKYNNTITDDLWNSLEFISKKPVKEIMHSWTQQTGYPIVTAKIENNKLILEQERFFYLKQKNKQLWHIPIEFYVNNKKQYHLMNTKKTEINLQEDITINKSQVGFYRINYDDKLFNKLNKSKLSFIEKLGLLNDTYALSRACYIPIDTYLKLAYSYRNETNHAIWDDISSSLGRVEFLFEDKYRKELNKFKINLYNNIYKKLGWDERKSDKHTDIMLRANVLGALGFAENKETQKEAVKRFNEFLKGKRVHPNLRAVVYDLAAFNGDEKVFNKIKELYMKDKSQEEKVRFLLALGLFKQKELSKKALDFSLSKDVKSQDKIFLVATVGTNSYADDIAWEFVKNKWNEFYKMYHDSNFMPSLIKSTTLRFKDLDKLKEIKEFFKKHDTPTAKLAIQQVLEVIQINHNVIKYNEKSLKEFLINNFKNT